MIYFSHSVLGSVLVVEFFDKDYIQRTSRLAIKRG